MKQVQKTISRWVKCLAGKNRSGSATYATLSPQQVDAKDLRRVAGGVTESEQLPVKGW